MEISKIISLAFCIALVWSIPNAGNTQVIHAVVADADTQQPIPDAFVFLDNSSAGTVTDENGIFQLSVPVPQNLVLVFSHINYELLTMEVAHIKSIKDTFFLQATQLVLEEAVVLEKSNPRLRARRLKAFRKAFIGANISKKKVKILNPEVLLFSKKRDQLLAEAKEPILIENRDLGYRIQYYLEDFELDDDGFVFYQGTTYFGALGGTEQEKKNFQKRRQIVYKKSSRSFFSDLIQQKLDTTNYLLGLSRMDEKKHFVNFTPIDLSVINIRPHKEHTFEVLFFGYLTIIDRSIVLETGAQTGNKPNLSQGVKEYNLKSPLYATSYLQAKNSKVFVSKYGTILNYSDVKQFGYWASFRVGATLPMDYSPE